MGMGAGSIGSNVTIQLKNVHPTIIAKLSHAYETRNAEQFVMALCDHLQLCCQANNLSRAVRNLETHEDHEIKLMNQISFEMTPRDIKRLMMSRASVSGKDIDMFDRIIHTIGDLEKIWRSTK